MEKQANTKDLIEAFLAKGGIVKVIPTGLKATHKRAEQYKLVDKDTSSANVPA